MNASRTIILIFLLVAILASFFVFGRTEGETKEILKIGSRQIEIETVSTQKKIQQGLSGRESLPANSGMYFVLGEARKATFWMKEMKFSLDIIWINDGKITAIEKNAPIPAGTNIPTFNSPGLVTHVLEVNTGFTDRYSIKIGDKVELLD